MKINRRKSLMAIIGGLFAPAVVQSGGMEAVNERFYGGQAVPQAGPYYGENAKTDAVPQSMEEYLLKERTRLNKMINGEFDEEHLEELENIRTNNYNVSSQNIEALKSVSAVHMNKMKLDKLVEERKKDWVLNAIRQLKRLNSQTRKN